MEPSDLLLLVVGKKDRVIPGRTAFQKLVYFVSTDLKSDLGYKAHFYGPYSPIVAQAAEFLVQTDFLREEETALAPGYTQYAYSLTKDGIKAAASARKLHANEDTRIQAVVDVCEKVAHLDTHVMSWAAKTHFISQGGPEKVWTIDALMEQGRAVGWDITPPQIRKGAELLFALGFAKEAKNE